MPISVCSFAQTRCSVFMKLALNNVNYTGCLTSKSGYNNIFLASSLMHIHYVCEHAHKHTRTEIEPDSCCCNFPEFPDSDRNNSVSRLCRSCKNLGWDRPKIYTTVILSAK